MKKFNAQKLALAISKKRKAENLSREKAAEIIGVSPATIGRLEHNEKRKSTLPDLDVYYKCCNWLGVEMETFFDL